jgi:hypothetical protein
VIDSEPQDRDTQTEVERDALAQIGTLDAVRAPLALRRSIEELTSGARSRARRRRALRLRVAGAGALAAVAAATAAIVLGAGTQQPPTVLAASRVALGAATLASPAEDPHAPGQLATSVEGVPYPYWGGNRGWPTAGARTDSVNGRSVTTVFYTSDRGTRVGYAIVAGHPLAEPAGKVVVRAGVHFRVLSTDGATVVTWREHGHTCILAARGVPARTLLHLVAS